MMMQKDIDDYLFEEVHIISGSENVICVFGFFCPKRI